MNDSGAAGCLSVILLLLLGGLIVGTCAWQMRNLKAWEDEHHAHGLTCTGPLHSPPCVPIDGGAR